MNDNHLDQFYGEAVAIVPQETYDNWMKGRPEIGYGSDENDLNGSMFVTTPNALNEKFEESNGDISKLESSLGFEEGHFGDNPPVIVNINKPEEHNLRIANGQEAGANEFFNASSNISGINYSDDFGTIDVDNTPQEVLDKINGQYWDNNGLYHAPNTEGYDGYTQGKMPEAVIDKVPNTPENVSYTQVDGMKRGESGNISFFPITDGNYDSSNLEKNVDFNCLYDNIDKEEPKFENPKSYGMEM